MSEEGLCIQFLSGSLKLLDHKESRLKTLLSSSLAYLSHTTALFELPHPGHRVLSADRLSQTFRGQGNRMKHHR